MSIDNNEVPEFEDPPFVPPEAEEYKDSADNAYRILFVGNSITRHGICLDPLKWDHVSGMAASCESNDFAHILAGYIQGTMPERTVEIYFGNVNAMLGISKQDSAREDVKDLPHPHLVIIQTGEHEGPGRSKTEMREAYENRLIRPFHESNPRPLILCAGLWNPGPYAEWMKNIDETYKEVCLQYGIPFISVEKIGIDPECHGWGLHEGVKWHPNDKGMKGYADLLFDAFKNAI